MKDIYLSMISQNILNNYRSKIESKTDFSELFDYALDKSDFIDLKLDNSDFVDFELDNSNYLDVKLDYSEHFDFELDFNEDVYLTPITISKSLMNLKVSYINYAIQNQDGLALLTQGGELIQFQY